MLKISTTITTEIRDTIYKSKWTDEQMQAIDIIKAHLAVDDNIVIPYGLYDELSNYTDEAVSNLVRDIGFIKEITITLTAEEHIKLSDNAFNGFDEHIAKALLDAHLKDPEAPDVDDHKFSVSPELINQILQFKFSPEAHQLMTGIRALVRERLEAEEEVEEASEFHVKLVELSSNLEHLFDYITTELSSFHIDNNYFITLMLINSIHNFGSGSNASKQIRLKAYLKTWKKRLSFIHDVRQHLSTTTSGSMHNVDVIPDYLIHSEMLNKYSKQILLKKDFVAFTVLRTLFYQLDASKYAEKFTSPDYVFDTSEAKASDMYSPTVNMHLDELDSKDLRIVNLLGLCTILPTILSEVPICFPTYFEIGKAKVSVESTSDEVSFKEADGLIAGVLVNCIIKTIMNDGNLDKKIRIPHITIVNPDTKGQPNE